MRNSSSLTSSSTARNSPRAARAAEGRIGFDGQMVCRNVLYAERQHSVERSFQRIPAEAGMPKIRSAVMFPNPARCAARTAPMACAAVWRRFISFRHPSSNDWMPIDRRSMPASRSPVEVIFRQVVGVGLEGGFRGAGAVEQQRGMIQQSFQRGGCVERRRAAAEIAGRDRSPRR